MADVGPAWDEEQQRSRADAFRTPLKNDSCDLDRIDRSQVGASDRSIYEVPLTVARLSDLLNNYFFPPIGEGEASHYTTLKACWNILNTKTLRLNAVRKRIDEGELSTFLNAAGYAEAFAHKEGYRSRVYEDLSDHLFYASFSEERDCKRLWKVFGDSQKGVRIDFKIKPYIPDLRRVVDNRDSLAPVIRMLERIRNECKREFILRRLSKICAFHLPSRCRTEAELRMLVSRFSDQYHCGAEPEIDGKGDKYISIPIGDLRQKCYYLEFARIQPGSKCRSAPPQLVSLHDYVGLLRPTH
jgi:hypothetical protein